MTLDDAAKIARENNPEPKHYRIDAETGVLKRPFNGVDRIDPEIPESTVEEIADLLIEEDKNENQD